MIVMSDIAYDWIALGVAAILFVILAFLKRKKRGFHHTRVACNGIRYHFGNRFQRPH